jgi:hypothetical protein
MVLETNLFASGISFIFLTSFCTVAGSCSSVASLLILSNVRFPAAHKNFGFIAHCALYHPAPIAARRMQHRLYPAWRQPDVGFDARLLAA